MANTNLVTHVGVQADERNIQLNEMAETNSGTFISRQWLRVASASRTSYGYKQILGSMATFVSQTTRPPQQITNY
jgi:hypothetical protein